MLSFFSSAPSFTVCDFYYVYDKKKSFFLSYETLSSAVDTEQLLTASYPTMTQLSGLFSHPLERARILFFQVYNLVNGNAISQDTWSNHLSEVRQSATFTLFPRSTTLFRRIKERTQRGMNSITATLRVPSESWCSWKALARQVWLWLKSSCTLSSRYGEVS